MGLNVPVPDPLCESVAVTLLVIETLGGGAAPRRRRANAPRGVQAEGLVRLRLGPPSRDGGAEGRQGAGALPRPLPSPAASCNCRRFPAPPARRRYTYVVSIPVQSSFLTVCPGASCVTYDSKMNVIAPNLDPNMVCGTLLSAFPPNTCYSTMTTPPTIMTQLAPGMSFAFQNSQFQAGLAFSVMAWIIDVVILILSAAAYYSNTHGSVQASLSGLPSLILVLCVSIAFRIIALGCGVNFEYKFLQSPGPLSSGPISTSVLTPFLGWTTLPSTGFILLFLALSFSIIATIFYYVVARGLIKTLAEPEPAAAPRVTV